MNDIKYSTLTASLMHMLATMGPRTDTFANSLGKLQHFARADFSLQNPGWLLTLQAEYLLHSNAIRNIMLTSKFFLHISRAHQPVIIHIAFLESHITFAVFQSPRTRVLLCNNTDSLAFSFLNSSRNLGLITYYLATSSIWFITSPTNSSIWKRFSDEFFFKKCSSTGNYQFFTISNRCKELICHFRASTSPRDCFLAGSLMLMFLKTYFLKVLMPFASGPLSSFQSALLHFYILPVSFYNPLRSPHLDKALSF